jgi:hypothetical protein
VSSVPSRAPIRGGRRTKLGRLAVLVLASLAFAGCSALNGAAPTPTPESFPGIADELATVGVTVVNWVSGDAGCDDASLTPTAIAFTARGLDQSTPIQLRIYIFRDRATWDRRPADVEACVAQWASDPANVELMQISPYSVAGQGPMGTKFKDALRQGLTTSAGTGD